MGSSDTEGIRSFLRDEEQKKLLKLREKRERNEEENRGKFSKVISYLGLPFYIPANIAYNRYAAGKNIPKRSLLSTETELSDIREIRNPNLIGDKRFQETKWKTDLISSIFLDASTYLTGGATKVGKLSKITKGLGFIDDAGDLLRLGNITKGSGFVIEDVGKTIAQLAKKYPDMNKLQDIIDKGNVIRRAGFKGKLADQPLEYADKLREGYTSLPMFGKVDLPFSKYERVVAPHLQAKMADVVGAGLDKVMKGSSSPARLIQKIFEGSPDKRIRKLLTTEYGDEVADSYINMKKRPRREIQSILESAELSTSEIRKYTDQLPDRVALQKAGKLDDVLGMTQEEIEQLLHVYQFPGKLEDFRRVGHYYGDYFDVSSAKKWNSAVEKFEPGFFSKFDGLIDNTISRMSQANIGRSKKLESLFGRLGVASPLEKYYIRQQDLFKKGVKTSKFFAKNYRGNGLKGAEQLRTMVKHIVDSEHTTDVQKAVAQLVGDERLIYGDHTIGQLIEFAKNPKKIIDKNPNFQAIVDSADDVRKRFNELRRSGDMPIKKVKEVEDFPIAAIFNTTKSDTLGDFYHKSIPGIEAFSTLDVATKTKELEFMNKIFVDGLEEGVSKIASGSDKSKRLLREEGFILLDKNKLTKVLPEFAKDELGDAYNTGSDYYYAIKKELYDILIDDGSLKFIKNPMQLLSPQTASGKLLEMGLKVYDKISQVFKETTLFTHASYYVRNLLDDGVRLAVEGAKVGDVKNAIATLGRHSDLLGWKKVVGGAKDVGVEMVTGKKITSKEFWDLAMDLDVLGDGIKELGVVGEDSLEVMIKRLEKSKVLGNKNLNMAKKLRNIKSVDGNPNFYRRFIDTGIKTQEHFEAMTRLTAFSRMLRKHPPTEAKMMVDKVMINYGDMSQFERKVINRVFAFYSFKKGISKYLLYKLATNPLLIKSMGKLPEAVEDAFQGVENLNPALKPEWLKQNSIHVGRDKDGNPKVLNMVGLTSFSELLSLIDPFGTAKQSLMPQLKYVKETLQGHDDFFKRPIEQYRGETRSVGGIQLRRKNPISRIAKNFRIFKTIGDITEGVLKDTDMSIFGTKDKKSLFGAGVTGDRVAQDKSDLFLKYAVGFPLTSVDVDRVKTAMTWNLRGDVAEYKRIIKKISRKYGKSDPKYTKKRITKETERIREIINKHKNSRTNKRNVDYTK